MHNIELRGTTEFLRYVAIYLLEIIHHLFPEFKFHINGF